MEKTITNSPTSMKNLYHPRFIFFLTFCSVFLSFATYGQNNGSTRERPELKPNTEEGQQIFSQFSKDFIYEVMKLYRWDVVETGLVKNLKITAEDAKIFMRYVKKNNSLGMLDFFNAVKSGRITSVNTDKYWEQRVSYFENIYNTKYLAYLNLKDEKNKAQSQNFKMDGNTPNTPYTGGAICNNLDFSAGNESGWVGKWNNQGSSDPFGLGYGNLTVNGLNNTPFNSMGKVHELCNGGTDPWIALNRVPPGHSFSVRLGDDDPYGQGLASYNHQTISNTFLVTQANKMLTYWYAVNLLQDQGAPHPQTEQPYFKIRMYDGSNNEILCARYDVDATAAAAIGGFNYTNDGFGEQFVWKNWSQVLIPLISYVGQNVTIKFESSDCDQGGHFGYAYLAVDCAPYELISSTPFLCGGNTATLTAPGGAATYSWAGTALTGPTNGQTATINAPGTYTVTMTTPGNGGVPCTFSIDTIINGAPVGPTANFTTNSPQCLGKPIQFTDASSTNGGAAITGYNWTFGDAGTSTALNPSHTYATAGNFVVNYTVTSSAGCTDSASATVIINPKPVVAFTVPAVCLGSASVFTNTSTPAGSTSAWTFGDAGTSAITSPTHTYATAGTFNAEVVVTTALGCIDSLTKPVTVNPIPVPAFTNTTVCLGTATSYTNTTPAVPAIGTWHWDFGDAGTSAVQNPLTHTYATAGTFTTTLSTTTTATPGCTATFTAQVVVNPQPTAVFTVPQVCLGTTTPFTNTSTAVAGSTFAWTFGDGQTLSNTGGNVTNTYTTAATFNATLLITAPGGCTSTVTNPVTVNPNALPSFTNTTVCLGTATGFTNTTPAAPPIGTWHWDFGDAGTSAVQNPLTHTYATAGTFTTTLSATTTATPGCTATFTAQVVVNPQPTAVFTVPQVCLGTATPFTNTSTAVAGSTFDWTFGDGQTLSNTGGNVTNTYTTAATFNATLLITAPGGCTSTVTNPVTVNPNALPSFTSTAVCLGVATGFTNTTPAAPPIGTWHWDFGDGNTDPTQNPLTHTYASAGTFTTTLTTTTTATPSCTGTYSATVVVHPNPVAAFTASTECQGTATVFNSSGSGISPPDNIGFYNWTFGDGANTSGPSPTHIYPSCGTYTTNLVVVSNNNCTNSTSVTVTVKCVPTVTVPPSATYCPAAAVPASNYTTNPAGATITWINSDPTIGLAAGGTVNTPAFTSANSGSTTLNGIIAVTPTLNGCIGPPSTYTITVNPTPIVNPIANATYCPAAPVPAADYTSTPTGASFAWTNTTTAIGLGASGAGNYAGFSATNAGSTVLSGILSVTPTLNTCVGPPVTYTINVNPTPVATVPANAIYCPFAPIPATGFNSNPAGASFNWTNTNSTIGIAASGAGQIGAFNALNTTTLVQNATIAVTPTLNTCVGLPVNYTITVNPTPYVTAIPDFVYCPAMTVPTTVLSSVPAGATFAWTNSNTAVGLAATSGTSDVTGFTSSNTGSTPINSTITITPTLNGCQGPDSTYLITINPTPQVTVPASASYCPSLQVPASGFTTVPAGGVTLNWTNNNTSIGLAAAGLGDYAQFTSINSGSINQVGTINVIPSLAGCIGPVQTFSITVFPKPIAVVPANSESCPAVANSGFNLSSIPADPATVYSWQHSNGNVGLITGVGIPSAGATIPAFTSSNTNLFLIATTFTVTTQLNGCLSDPQNFTFTVNPNPFANFSYSHTCQGSATNFTDLSMVSSGTIQTWNWDFDNNGTIESSGPVNTPNYTIASSGPDQVNLSVVTNKGCIDDTTITIYINPNPVPTIAVDNPAGCADHFANLTGAVTAASISHPNSIVQWQWDVDNNGSIDVTDFHNPGTNTDVTSYTYVNPSHTTPLTYSVSLTATSDSGCVGTYTTVPPLITVYPIPLADFTWGPANPAPDIDIPQVYFYNQAIGATTMQWDLGDVFATNPAVNFSTSFNPEHYYDHYDPYTYMVTQFVQNTYGCKDTIIKPVEILPNWTFYIPNAYTPNGDGINDGFRGTGIGINSYNLWIFDRWGNMIFYSTDLDAFWNGTVQGHDGIVQEDVYVWKVKFKDLYGKKHDLVGTVTVVK